MTAELPRAWWRDYWDAFTRSGVYDPATMAYRARMERLAARWETEAREAHEQAQRMTVTAETWWRRQVLEQRAMILRQNAVDLRMHMQV